MEWMIIWHKSEKIWIPGSVAKKGSQNPMADYRPRLGYPSIPPMLVPIQLYR